MDWKALQMATSGQSQPAQQSGGFGMVGSGMSAAPAQTDPYAFIKANYNMADEAGSTRKIWDEAQRQGWGNDVLGQGLGFSGQQVQDHFAKYGLGGQAAQPQGNMFGSPDMGIPTPVQAQSPAPTQMGQGMMGNPYLQGMGDDIGRRTQQMLDANLGGIRSNAIMAGGFGGSRQGIAEGQAISGAADAMQGNLSNMFGSAYNADSNRMVQRYGMDQNYNLGLGGLTNQAYGNETQRGLGMGSLQNQAIGQAQNFYTAQRGQDQTGMALGANLAQQGMQMPWTPIQNASNTYSPYTGFGTSTTGGQTGGGWQGAIGGALGGAQLGKNMGWW